MNPMNSDLFNYLNFPHFITVNNYYENIKYEYINHTKKRKTMNFQTVISREQFKSKIIQTNCITETRMWGKRPAAMLAIYTGRGVAPEVNLRECISRMPPQSSNKAEDTLALKPRGDITRSPKQGYQWPQK